MKKVYRFNLIPGVEFVEEDGFYYAASDDPIWPKSHITKVTIDGLLEYEKKLKDMERNCSVLNDQIEYIKKCAENEIDHRNKLLEENDKSIEYIRGKLHEEIMKNEAYKETLKKKDDIIKKLRGTADFSNDICIGYTALNDSLMTSIEEKNSEIKILSDQVTRLMDQLKEITEENPGCKSCSNGPKPCCDICGNTDCEHRVETDEKSETNLGKFMYDMFLSALDTWLKGSPICDDIKPCRLTSEMVAEYERSIEKEAKLETKEIKFVPIQPGEII